MSTAQPTHAGSIQIGNRLSAETPIAKFFADPNNMHGVATNIDLTGDAGLALVMKCQSQPTVPTDSMLNVPFPCKYYYAHPVEMNDQRTGEVLDRVRLVLVSPEGETCSFVSQGVIDSLDIVRRFKGDGPYNPPVRFKVSRQATRRGNTVLRLEVAIDEAPAQSPVDSGRKKS